MSDLSTSLTLDVAPKQTNVKFNNYQEVKLKQVWLNKIRGITDIIQVVYMISI